MFDHPKHLTDAFVNVTHELADCRLVGAERHLAGGRALYAHLLLHRCCVYPVPGAQRSILVHQELGDNEHRKAFGARSGALGSSQHEVDDVLGGVVLAAGDESFDALDVPGAVAGRYRLCGAGPDIGSGVRLRQDHGAGPPLFEHPAGQPLLILIALFVEHPGEHGRRCVEQCRRIAACQKFLTGPDNRAGKHQPSCDVRHRHAIPSAVSQRRQAGLQAVREANLAVDELERDTVGIHETVGPFLAGETLDLTEHVGDHGPVSA